MTSIQCLRDKMKILYSMGLLLGIFLHMNCNAECCQSTISSLQIGGDYTYANIKIQGDSFRGSLGGVQGSYEYKPWNNIYAGLRLAWKAGRTGGSGDHRCLTYVDAQERIGYTYSSPCNNWQITPFTGLGYRFLGHKLEQSGSPSIKFDYNEFYVPVGFLTDYSFNSCWSLGLNFTWMPQIYPTVEIIPLKGARWILQSSLSNFLVELPLTFSLTECGCYSIIFKPFYEHWKDGRSTAKTFTGNSLGLPANSYNFWGTELNFAFSF